MDKIDILILQNAALVIAALAEQFDNPVAKNEAQSLATHVANIALRALAHNASSGPSERP